MNRIAWGIAGALVALATSGLGPVGAATDVSQRVAVAAPAASASVADESREDRSRQATGTIVAVDRQAGTVIVKSKTGDRTFVMSPKVQVKLGRLKATLAEVSPGKKVLIRYREIEGQATATTIKVL